MSESGENRSRYESRETPEVSLRNLLEGETSIEHLSDRERGVLIEKAQGMIIEADPAIKPKYQNLLQRLRLAGGHDSKYVASHDPSVVISDEYRIRSKDKDLSLGVRAERISNYSELAHLGINLDNLDRGKSSAYLLCATESEQRCWINMKLYRVVARDGSKENFLYIADRYVAPNLRGQKLGDQLLEVADNIAKANRCVKVFAQLIPEDPKDVDVLGKGMQKAGFVVSKGEGGGTLAEKQIQ